MDEGDWNSGFARSLMVFLNGDAIPELDHMGRPIYDDHFLLLFNAHWEPINFTLPPRAFGSNWQIRLDTTTGAVDPPNAKRWRARSRHAVDGRSLMVLSTTVVPDRRTGGLARPGAAGDADHGARAVGALTRAHPSGSSR